MKVELWSIFSADGTIKIDYPTAYFFSGLG